MCKPGKGYSLTNSRGPKHATAEAWGAQAWKDQNTVGKIEIPKKKRGKDGACQGFHAGKYGEMQGDVGQSFEQDLLLGPVSLLNCINEDTIKGPLICCLGQIKDPPSLERDPY